MSRYDMHDFLNFIRRKGQILNTPEKPIGQRIGLPKVPLRIKYEEVPVSQDVVAHAERLIYNLEEKVRREEIQRGGKEARILGLPPGPSTTIIGNWAHDAYLPIVDGENGLNLILAYQGDILPEDTPFHYEGEEKIIRGVKMWDIFKNYVQKDNRRLRIFIYGAGERVIGQGVGDKTYLTSASDMGIIDIKLERGEFVIEVPKTKIIKRPDFTRRDPPKQRLACMYAELEREAPKEKVEEKREYNPQPPGNPPSSAQAQMVMRKERGMMNGNC